MPGFAAGDDVRFEIDVDQEMMSVWDTPFKHNSVVGVPVAPSSYWVEWIHPDSRQPSPVKLSVIDAPSGNVAYSYEIAFKPFESTVIVFTGEFQTPHDPRVGERVDHGIMRFAYSEYANGYDVHLLDEDDLHHARPEGPAFDEVVNAVNNRGVTEVAIMGYSHGGGSTYLLSKYMAETRLIRNPYTTPFTAYVDAVRQPFINIIPETRRPLRSLFHLNQYQKNDTPHGARGHGDDESDRSGLGVKHRHDRRSRRRHTADEVAPGIQGQSMSTDNPYEPPSAPETPEPRVPDRPVSDRTWLIWLLVATTYLSIPAYVGSILLKLAANQYGDWAEHAGNWLAVVWALAGTASGAIVLWRGPNWARLLAVGPWLFFLYYYVVPHLLIVL